MLCDIFAAPAYNDCQLSLVVYVTADTRNKDRLAMTDQGTGHFMEQDGIVGYRHTSFGCMLAIIQSEANDFTGTQHWRQQRDLVKGVYDSLQAEIVVARRKLLLDKSHCMLSRSE